MTYLFTYKNGKKALGITNINYGLAIKAGNKTVYPLLVSTSATNASCVRTKINNQIRSIAYVPSLVIPMLLCSKEGSSYNDASGINYTNRYYRSCYFDRKYGHYIAFSSYRGISGDTTNVVAISKDGRNWTEKYILAEQQATAIAAASTNEGVILFQYYVNVLSQYDSEIYIKGYQFSLSGNTIQTQEKYSRKLYDGYPSDYWVDGRLKIATNGADKINLYIHYEKDGSGTTHTDFYDFLNINVTNNTITHIDYWEKDAVWYNRVLNRFFYKESNDIYISSDGINFSLTSGNYQISYGNLNGAEVFAGGLSTDGYNISQPYTYRPNTYDPVEQKYIRIETSFSYQSTYVQYYVDIYESTNLTSWTRVIRKTYPTVLAPQTLETVNTDGFAGVQGF